MFHRRNNRSAAIALVTLVVGGAALAGCSAPPDADAADRSEAGATTEAAAIDLLPKNDAIAAMVPEALRSKGALVIATNATVPPNQYVDTDGKTIIGNEVDFANQLGSILGLKVEWVNTSFSSIIPGLQAGRYDMAISGFRDTKEREKLVNFVTYAQAGPQLFTKAELAENFSTLDSLCGHSVGVEAGTVQERAIEDQSAKCTSDGSEPIAVKTFNNQNDMVQAISSGQVEVGAQNAPSNAYLTKQTDGALVAVGEPFATGPWGFPIPKENGLTDAVLAATKELVNSTQYEEILQKWGVESQAIDVNEVVINGAIN